MSNILSGGSGPNYEKQPMDEKAIRNDASGIRPQWPSTQKIVLDALPSDSVKVTTANLKAFRELLAQLDDLSVGKAGEHYARTIKEAADSGDPTLASASLSQTKEKLRAQRRELNIRFTQQYQAPHFSACVKIGKAAKGALEDLILAEDDADLKKLTSYGLKQVEPCSVVRSLLAVRTYLKNRLEYISACLDNPGQFIQFQPETDFLKACGVQVWYARNPRPLKRHVFRLHPRAMDNGRALGNRQ